MDQTNHLLNHRLEYNSFSIQFRRPCSFNSFIKFHYCIITIFPRSNFWNIFFWNILIFHQYKFSTFNEKGIRVVEMKESSVHKLKELEHKIKELEQAVGQKQMMIDYLEKMIDIAKEDLDIDIKKNYGSQRSAGSGNIPKKKNSP